MTSLIRTLAGVMVAASVACGGAASVDQIPLGAEVAVTRQDGGVVRGTLTERDATIVRIAVGDNVREVTRTQIAAMQVVDETTPLALPASARFTEHTLPAGTVLQTRLATAVDSKTGQVDQIVNGALTEALVVDGLTVAPIGAEVSGVVTAVESSGKVKGLASLALAFRSMTVDGHEAPYAIAANRSFTATTTRRNDAAKIGATTVGGAVVGGLLGGKKGAVIGGAVGGGAGTAVVLSTAGEEVTLAAGAVLRLELEQPVTIRMPIARP